MAIRQSTGLRDFILRDGPFKRAFNNGVLKIYTGTQPASADDATAGTLLVTVSASSGAVTSEVLSSGGFTISGTSGSISSVTINSVAGYIASAVPFNTSLTITAADIATAISNSMTLPHYTATSSGAVVTIKAMPGTGTTPNTYTVAAGVTGDMGVGTPASFSGGVAAVNGLQFGSVTSGQMVLSGTWSGIPVATGTAGCFRFQSTIADAGGSSTSLIRFDGNISTAAADLNLTTTSITTGVPFAVSTFNAIEPAS